MILLALLCLAQYAEGLKLFEQGRIEEARTKLIAAVQAEPKNAAAWKALGVTWAAQSNYHEAEEPFRKACELAPALPDACFYWARALYALDRFEPSLAALKKLVPDARTVLAMAQAEEALGLAVEAEAHFRKAGDPVKYGVFLFRQGRLAEAESVMKAGQPRTAEAWWQLGRVLYQAGKLGAAREAIEKSLALDAKQEAARLLLEKIKARER